MTKRRSRLLSTGFFLVLCGVAVGGYFIVRAAQQAVLESRAGSVAEYSLDPDEPGFLAFTEATPTALVLHTAVVPGLGADLAVSNRRTRRGHKRIARSSWHRVCGRGGLGLGIMDDADDR